MSEEPFDPQFAAHQFAQGIAQMRETFAPIDEATLGYRVQLEAAGWSPTVAEQMAFQFFTVLMNTVLMAGNAAGSGA